MTSTNASSDNRAPKATAPRGNIMTSFRPLPDISEEEQEHLISLAMEATGLKQYQRWDTVEYTIIDSIKNRWQLLLQKAKKAFTGKAPSPDATPSSSSGTKPTEDGATHKALLETVYSLDSTSRGKGASGEEEEEEEGWTVLR
ncbi:hypothetical protein Q9L58_009430 [Maublancomyces gigas]|uniref:Myb-like domain-containing protein n=1 Tax=Discina gigas TaxID=1032678 RepID=A0ABR3G6Y4_9PEZI